jgi:hypothetical protein
LYRSSSLRRLPHYKREGALKTLKWEKVNLWAYQRLEDVKRRIPYFLQEVFNQKRLNSCLRRKTRDERCTLELL